MVNLNRYYQMKSGENDNLPLKLVSDTEFVELALANGMSEAKAELQAKLCRKLGSCVKLGEQLVMVPFCHAQKDGDCNWEHCPPQDDSRRQHKEGSWCPFYWYDEED